jgi:hypothetical protein
LKDDLENSQFKITAYVTLESSKRDGGLFRHFHENKPGGLETVMIQLMTTKGKPANLEG